jgi:predicted DsbA family dithiol-disulfide isomerase
LHPYIPVEGMSIEDLLAGRNIDLAEMKKRLKAAAANAGLLYTGPKLASNSRLAQEMGKWADSQGKGDMFHLAVFTSYFVEEKNIGDAKVLVKIAEQVGLSGVEAGEVVEKRTFQKAVDQDWARSREQFVTAVPTFMMGTQRLVGAQSYDELKRFVETNR